MVLPYAPAFRISRGLGERDSCLTRIGLLPYPDPLFLPRPYVSLHLRCRQPEERREFPGPGSPSLPARLSSAHPERQAGGVARHFDPLDVSEGVVRPLRFFRSGTIVPTLAIRPQEFP